MRIFSILVVLTIVGCSGKISFKKSTANSANCARGDQATRTDCSPTETFQSDTAGSITLSSDAATGRTNLKTIPVKAVFSSIPKNPEIALTSIAGAKVRDFTGAELIYTFNLIPAAEGVLKLKIPEGSTQNSQGADFAASNELVFQVDWTPPSAVITSSATTETAVSPIPVTIEFSEPVDLTLSVITVNGGVASNLKGSGKSYRFDLVPGANGIISAAVAKGGVKDLAGNASASEFSLTLTYNADAPTATISSTAGTITNSSPIPITVNFSESVTGFAAEDLVLSNALVDAFSADAGGKNYRINLLPVNEGVVTAAIASDAAVSANGKGNSASAALTVDYDATPPTVTIGSVSAAYVNTGFTVDAIFSEPVSGLSIEDIQVQNGSASGLTGSGSSFSFTVTPSGSPVTVNLAAGSANDTASNPNLSAAQLSRVYDTTLPTVTLSSSAPANVNTTFGVTATFSESVTGFTADDISINNGIVSNFSTTSGDVYTFDVAPAANGAVNIDIDDDVATDLAGNFNNAATTLTRTYDATAPSVVLSSSSAATVNAAFTVTATFDESVTNFSETDLTVANGSISGFTGSGSIYSFTISPTSSGTVTIDIASGAASDAAGNGSTAATQLSRTYDYTPPTIAMTSGSAATTNNNPIVVSVSISESTANFAETDLVLTNATVSDFSGSGNSYSFNLIPSGQGAVRVDVPGGRFTDAAGNNNTAMSQFSRTFDSLAPPPAATPGCSGGETSNSVSWTSGGGDTIGFLVVRRLGGPVTWIPTAGVNYSSATHFMIDNYKHWRTYAGTGTNATDVGIFPGLAHHYAVYPYDSAYNYAAPLSMDCTPKVLALLENIPPAVFSGTSLAVRVSGFGITEYKYALVDASYHCAEAAYSPWTDVATHITETPDRGAKRLCVIARDASNVEQPTATEYYFRKAAHTTILRPNRWDAKVNQGDTFRIRWEDHNATDNVTGTLSFYYATARSTDCSAATTIATGISQNTTNKWHDWDTGGIPTGTYHICVTSYDGTTTISYWADGTVTVEDYCSGSALSNTLTSGDNGTGTSGDPYNVCTLTQLVEIRSMAHTGKYFKQRRDIDASDTVNWDSAQGWAAGTFTFSEYDGNGYTITNLYSNRGMKVGLFGHINNNSTVVKRIWLEDFNISGSFDVGGIAGHSNGTITESYVRGTITGSAGSSYGGAVGKTIGGGIVSRIISDAVVTGTGNNFGGVVGESGSAGISDIWSRASLSTSSTGDVKMGGVVGYNSYAMARLIFSGSVTGSSGSRMLGGIQGYDIGGTSISRATFAGTVTSNNQADAGGIIGRSVGTFTGTALYGAGTVTQSGTSGENIGQIFGSSTQSMRLTGCAAIGAVTQSFPASYAGGIGGFLNRNSGPHWILYSYSRSTVSTAGRGGGLVGFAGDASGINGAFIGNYATGNVSCASTWMECGGYVGLIGGSATGVVNSYATGNVTNSGANSGGFFGHMYSSRILDSYAAGNVSNGIQSSFGGFGGRGFYNHLLTNIFSAGTVGGSGTLKGGLVGERDNASNPYTNVYWYKPGGNSLNCLQTDYSTATLSCGTYANQADFQTLANEPMASWDTPVWWKIPVSGSYPILKWQTE